MKSFLVAVVLVVSHASYDGTWITTRSDMPSMAVCEKEKKLAIAGLKGDAVEEYEVECVRE